MEHSAAFDKFNSENPSQNDDSDQKLFDIPGYANIQKGRIHILQLHQDLNHLKRVLKTIILSKGLQHQCLLTPISIRRFNNQLVLRFPFLDFNLCNLMGSQKKIISEEHVKIIFYQLAMAVGYLHAQNIAHTNLRPEKVLISRDSAVRLSGLDESRIKGIQESETFLGVVTDYYSAPETLLGERVGVELAKSADVWSLGCILFELLTGKRVFHFKRTQLDLLLWMLKLLGKPESDFAFSNNIEARKWLQRRFQYPKRTASSYLPPFRCSKGVCHLLDRLLMFDPRERLSVVGILKHPYFKDIHESHDVEFEKANLDVAALRFCDYREMRVAAVKDSLFSLLD